MKQIELEEKIATMEKEIAELKMHTFVQYIPCYLQHYPVYPQPYFPQSPTGLYYPIVWKGNQTC